MKISTIPNTKNLTRYQEIISVLAPHGFGWLVAELKLRGLLPLAQQLGSGGEVEASTQATHLRLAFEELGTTFIKLGQVLSTRADILSPDYISELAKLQDTTPTVPYEQISAVFEAELGAPPDNIFASFDPTPPCLSLDRPGARGSVTERGRGSGQDPAPRRGRDRRA